MTQPNLTKRTRIYIDIATIVIAQWSLIALKEFMTDNNTHRFKKFLLDVATVT